MVSILPLYLLLWSIKFFCAEREKFFIASREPCPVTVGLGRLDEIFFRGNETLLWKCGKFHFHKKRAHPTYPTQLSQHRMVHRPVTIGLYIFGWLQFSESVIALDARPAIWLHVLSCLESGTCCAFRQLTWPVLQESFGGSLQSLNIPSPERLVKAKSDGSLASTGQDEALSRVKSRSLEPMSGLAMWSSETQHIELLKGSRGLGFSILDYQVSSLL